MKFLHTADWQIGKPFAGVRDPHKRSLLQQERIEAIKRLGRLAGEQGASLMVVAGDLFDSASADKATVAAACGAIGGIGLPVYAIPGNHDHAGPGSLWEQSFFRQQARELAPNLTVWLERAPVRLAEAVFLPCPLVHRSEPGDPTGWLRDPTLYADLPAEWPRVVVAHGSTQDFGAQESGLEDEEEGSGGAAANRIDLGRLSAGQIDYVALGDWHGVKQVGPAAWYSGTPELDRFVKGSGHRPGCALLVEARRGQVPVVTEIPTARLRWSTLEYRLVEDGSLAGLEARLEELVGKRVQEDLLALDLEGALGLQATANLERILETLEARLLRLKLGRRVRLAPGPEEIQALAENPGNPLLAAVARRLLERCVPGHREEETASAALRELYLAMQQEGTR